MTEWLTYELKTEQRCMRDMLIGTILAIVLFAIGVVANIYKAGKYANGGREVIEGDGAAASSAISAVISFIIAVLLYLQI